MKKISLLILLGIFLASGVPSYALIQTGNLGTTTATKTSEKTAVRTQLEENRVTDLKQRATTEITRRINFLTELSQKIDALKKLSVSQKEDLKSQIQTQINGLNELQAKINADTDLTTLKTDVKSIINGYYIFAYFRVKISLLVASERMSVATDTMNTVYTKLQTRISQEESKGTDVTALNALLSDMLIKINSAKTQLGAVQTELSSLTPQGFPGNKSTLLGVRAKLKQGEKDLRAAYQDAVKIRQGLGDISGNLRKGTFEVKESTKSSVTK